MGRMASHYSPLEKAIRNQDANRVEKHLTQLLSKQRTDLSYYLRLVLDVGSPEIIKKVMELLLQYNLPLRVGENGMGPIHYVAFRRDKRLLDFLQTLGFSLAERDLVGRNAYHYWVAGGQKELLPPEYYQPDNQGVTPIHIAAQLGNIEILEKLLEEMPSRLEERDEKGNTPLHYAAIGSSKEAAEFLLRKGASLYTRNRRNETPEQVAMGKGNMGIKRYLEEIGHVYRRAFAALREKNKKEIERVLALYPNPQDRFGNTLLHKVMDEEMALWLIEKGVNTLSLNHDGITPFIALQEKGLKRAAQEIAKRRSLTPQEEEYLKKEGVVYAE
ncbi:MAG: ankyrin repeat domain-containing protein [Candidatus Micrarchaeota archaeon]|nr:ankyrin repeat domain-containing protein [Candidatus Micrarchaeota archaeon]